MVKVVDAILSPLVFNRYPVSILAALLYGLVFASVLFSDSLPRVNYTKSFDQAVTDLTQITARPHPYLSHANDHVRSYLLSRIGSIDSDIEVIDDLNSTVLYSPRPGVGVYFEGTNILVKVPGSGKHDSNAVLFSAHYDSVSSAPGATDNGIGVVAALHFLEYLANVPRNERPRRTAIFNINNNEEDGLHGAHTFMIHPWAKLTTTFLNLDGAGAGGRPILFRTTALSPTEAFLKGQPKTGYSHANVLSQDAFGRGVIKSGTDWQVYKDTMDGVDLAFYKNRALYHTKFDSLTYAEGGRRSLQAMIEAVRYGGLEMLGAPATPREGRKDPIFFDILGRYNYIWEMNTVFVINVVFLVVFPVFLVSCLVIYLFVARGNFAGRYGDIRLPAKIWRGIKACLGVSQFVIALAVAASLETALVLGFLKWNPYVVHSQAPFVLVSALSLAYLSVVLPITAIKNAGITPTKSKNISTISLYIFTWVLLVVYTSVLRGQRIGGMYWATIWNFLAFLSVLIVFAQSLVGLSYPEPNASVDEPVADEVEDSVPSISSPNRKYVSGIEHVPSPGQMRAGTSDDGDDRDDEDEGGVTRETEPTEITPLMHQHRRYEPDGRVVVDAVDDPGYHTTQAPQGDEIMWWIAQMILGVPIPALLVYEITVLLFGALPQTLIDGSGPSTVYGALAMLSTLIILPIAPFAHKMHGRLNFLVVIIFVAATLFCLSTHPFTQVAPMKVRFVQQIHLGKQAVIPLTEQSPEPIPVQDLDDKDEVLSATSSVFGLPKHVQKVISELPSSHGKDVRCKQSLVGLTNCTWPLDEEWFPSPGGNVSSGWVTGDIKRVDGKTSQATIHVRGTNTRGCRIYFDQPIFDYKVRALDGDRWDGAQQDGYETPPEGITTLFLWSRTWDRNFEVEVTLGPEGVDPAPSLSGKLACEYSEYTSGIAGAGRPRRPENDGRIPGFEEMLRFLPKWAVVTKAADGLVEVSRSFSL